MLKYIKLDDCRHLISTTWLIISSAIKTRIHGPPSSLSSTGIYFALLAHMLLFEEIDACKKVPYL